MKKRLVNLIIIIIGLILIGSTIRATVELWQAGGKVTVSQERVEKLEKENKVLEKSLAQAQSPEMVERAIREKLNLVKPGEVVVIMPKDFMSSVSGEIIDKRQNWEKWARLIF